MNPKIVVGSQFLKIITSVPKIFCKRLGANVNKVGPYVVKVGRMEEAYSSSHASFIGIPTPNVLGIIRRGSTTYIITRYVKGKTLGESWKDMNDTHKHHIILDLIKYMDIMRNDRHNHICSINDGKIIDNMIFVNECGPFKSQKEFNEVLLSGIEDKLSCPILDIDRNINFTHGDLAPHNIIVKNNKIVSIVDWEYSGYFPEYWEYTKMGYPKFKRDSWKNMFSEYFHNYEEELKAIEKVVELKPSF